MIERRHVMVEPWCGGGWRVHWSDVRWPLMIFDAKAAALDKASSMVTRHGGVIVVADEIRVG